MKLSKNQWNDRREWFKKLYHSVLQRKVVEFVAKSNGATLDEIASAMGPEIEVVKVGEKIRLALKQQN